MAVIYDYKLTRAKRRSISICIKNGCVEVKAPLKTDIKTIENFLETKSKWIYNKLQESERRHKRFADIFDFDNFLYLGERVRISAGERKSFSIQNGVLIIPKIYYEKNVLCKSTDFCVGLKRFYKKAAKQYLENRLKEISVKLNLPFAEFSLTNAKTKWGSCDNLNRIRLNWHLVLLKPWLADYVIIHELAHTAEHNHSKKFWGLVGDIFPDFKEAIKCLKECGVLIEFLR